jgi:hypothetical protein
MNITQGDNSFMAGATAASSGFAVVETVAAEGAVGAAGVDAEGSWVAGAEAPGAIGVGPAGAG